MKTQGVLKIQGTPFQVQGHSWMDREWSTSALEKGQIGWDWFALQPVSYTHLTLPTR